MRRIRGLEPARKGLDLVEVQTQMVQVLEELWGTVLCVTLVDAEAPAGVRLVLRVRADRGDEGKLGEFV